MERNAYIQGLLETEDTHTHARIHIHGHTHTHIAFVLLCWMLNTSTQTDPRVGLNGFLRVPMLLMNNGIDRNFCST